MLKWVQYQVKVAHALQQDICRVCVCMCKETNLSVGLAMAALQLTAQSPRDITVRGRFALLVVLLGQGQGNTTRADQAALRHPTNQS